MALEGDKERQRRVRENGIERPKLVSISFVGNDQGGEREKEKSQDEKGENKSM